MRLFSLKILLSLTLVWPLLACKLKANTPILDSLIYELNSHNSQDTIRAELLNAIGFESYTNDLEQTVFYAKELLNLSNELNYQKGIMNANNLFGIYYDYKGDYHQALKYYQKSYELAQKINLPAGISAGFNNLGMVHDILGNYPLALDYYLKSLKIDIERNDFFGVANSYMNIGNLYESLNDEEKAMDYYQKAYQLSDSLGIDKLIAYGLINIGYIYSKQHEKDTDRLYFHKSLDLSKKNQSNEGILLANLMLGILEKDELNHAKAIQIFKNSLELCIELGSKAQERYCYYHMAEVYYNQKNYDKALENVQKAYVDDEYSDEKLRIDCVDLFSKIYKAKGDYYNAYQYHVVLKTLHDHSFNDVSMQKVANLEFQYKYDMERKALEMEKQKTEAINKAEKKRQKTLNNSLIAISILLLLILLIILISLFQRRKSNLQLLVQKMQLEKANDLLKRKNMEIEEVAKKLDHANHTKDTFFSIIAHDLRSPFNTILGFSNILLDEGEDFDKQERKEFLGRIKSGSETALNLLENLINWSRSNSGNISFNPKIIKLKDTVEEVCNLYNSVAQRKKINLNCLIQKEEIIYADEEMLRTIIRNLVSNAIKFTSENGEIQLKSSSDDNFTFIHIKDNGVGMSKLQTNRLFELNKQTTTKGTSGEKGTGLGLILCYEFTKKHQGLIKINSEEGEGTEVIVSFPKY